MKYSYNNVYFIICYDQIDECVQQVLDFDYDDEISVVLSHNVDFTEIEKIDMNIYVPQNVQKSTLALQTALYGKVFIDLIFSHKKFLSSILQAPELELKHLPNNFKYVFIGDNNTLPVIITKGLISAQEEKLMELLHDHKTTISWTLVDIKGITPSMCMHHILLKDNVKPTKEIQRSLNLLMMEVVKT
jgi:hypothetical protein